MKRALALPFVVVAALAALGSPARAAERARVVIVTLPGITWTDVRNADAPALDALIRRGAVGALATRTVTGRPNAERGYLTFGAGNRGYVGADDPEVHLAYAADDEVEGGDARSALGRRVGRARDGEIVHLGIVHLQTLQDERLYDARVGSLGEALAEARVRRAIVSASDVAQRADAETFRRSAVTALMDETGTIDDGVLDGLLRAKRDAPFGVAVDELAFADAVLSSLRTADVVLAEPGETLRADEFVSFVPPERIGRIRRAALERADQAIGTLIRRLPKDTTVMVLAPSPPSYAGTVNHLTPIVFAGPSFGRGWLTSPTTKQPGQITLVDIAPTILDLFDATEPGVMSGTPIVAHGSADADRVETLDELDAASVFRERYSAAVFYVLAVLISLLAILAFVVFLGGYRRAFGPLVAVAYFGLAIFPAAHFVRALEYWRFGQIGAHAALYAMAALLAVVAWLVPGPRWTGGVALLLGSAAVFALDFVEAGPLQVNGVFGHSPVVAGRFYGAGNVGVTILYSALILGLMGFGEMRRWRAAPWWVAVVFGAAVVAVGLPQFGADFGGMATGVAAGATTMTLARGRRVGWRWALVVAAAGVALTTAATVIDLLRPAEVRTHLGRFASTVSNGGVSSFVTIVLRKAASQLGSLAVTRWTYFIPVGIAVLVLLLYKPRGVLRDVLPRRPMLRAGLWGVMVAGVVGFALNDSGISIPALTLAHAVSFLVLFAVETVSPRASVKDASG